MTDRAKAHVFVRSLDKLVLGVGDEHHLARVLRLQPGEVVTASDGAGAWRSCRWSAGALAPDGEVTHDPRPAPAITIAFALTKGDRPEWVVQKLTEIGVDVISPFVAERSVVRWDEARAARAVDRWTIVAREAAMQSRRTWLPEIEPVTSFRSVAGREGVGRAERGGEPVTLARPVLLIGPEGGWGQTERLDRPSDDVALGPMVLRAETAAIVGAALLCGLRAGVVRSA